MNNLLLSTTLDISPIDKVGVLTYILHIRESESIYYYFRNPLLGIRPYGPFVNMGQ